MKLSRKLIVGLFTFTAIYTCAIWVANTPPRSRVRMEPKSRFAGIDQQLQEIEHLQQTNKARLDQLLDAALFPEEGKTPPMWWRDFWVGVGTLLLFGAICLLIGLVGVGIYYLWLYHPLALLVIPAIPLIAFFGHFARDVFWDDQGHKH